MTPVGSTEGIRAYRVDMTKLLHMIIVSDDFRTFLHVHPILQADGHFLLDQKFPSPALYHIYADAEPEGFGHLSVSVQRHPLMDRTTDLAT